MTNLEHLNMAEEGACALSPGPNNPMHDPRRAW